MNAVPKAELCIGGKRYAVDFSAGQSIAIALDFDGAQPSHFGAPPASRESMQAGGFIGDTRRGGSCNVPILTINPHCNGTHTESVWHISDEPVPITSVLTTGLIPAVLVSIAPVYGLDSGEHYQPSFDAEDRIIGAQALRVALTDVPDEMLTAVVIRTRPNPVEKCAYQYGPDCQPPFLSIDAVDYLLARGVQHLLVDFPSVDRMYDEGKMVVHHRFWQVPEPGHVLATETRREATITEMIYAPDTLVDGMYLLNLQIPAFLTDAAPSRPVLYSLELL